MNEKLMVKFWIQKIVKLVTLLAAVSAVTFFLLELSPIDPVTAYVGADTKIGAKQRELIAEHWGLDRPAEERFLLWFKNVCQGDWGTSMIYRRPVMEVIGQKFLSSLALMMLSWCISGLMGFGLGILMGVWEGTWGDRMLRVVCHILISTPTFWIGIVFVMLFSVKLGWFPAALGVPVGMIQSEVTIWDRIYHLILPALTLSVTGIANICMHTREKTVDVMHSDYVLFAKARGENRWEIILHHVIRNVSLPAITLQFLSFSELFGGAVFVEQVFSYPGLGQATTAAGLKGDAPLLMGIVVISLLFVYSGNLIADLLYRLIDPELKEGNMA